MAANPIPKILDDLFTMAEDAADGANQFGAAIGLLHNTEPVIRTDLTDGMTKEEQYQAERSGKKPLSTTVRVQDSNVKAYILLARDVLTGNLVRHILIGGRGTDRLPGGDGEDILIGGTTA